MLLKYTIMIIKRFYFVAITFLVFLMYSCGERYPDHPWEWDNEDTEKNPTITAQGWTAANSYGELPGYIQVYKSPDQLSGKKAIAYIAVADMAKTSFDILGDVAYSTEANGYGGSALTTPSEFYQKSKYTIVTNAGLFYAANGFYYSQNLVVRGGKMLCINQNYYSEDWTKLWYPTVGAFCQMQDGTFQTVWTYYSNTDKVNYYYPEPANNDIKKEPLEVPSSTFPAGAKILNATNAIGGVTVLLHGGEIKNTYVQEMLDISAATNQPRTAIGYTADKKMILFVCEGRNMTEGVSGLTTADVAKVMKDLGCTEALNLDGGGSSCMLINGKETIKGSDGKQRRVLTAIGLK